MARLFNNLDADKTGTLSREEYEAALSFEAINSDNDAVLSQQEFLRA